jgi:serine/threonine protein kinase
LAIQKGDIVGDYAVLGLLGSGGMGAVYKIEHLITKRIEAMKVLPLSLGSGPDEERRFEREIQVQARLHHPNIAALYNAVRQGDSIALIMEFVEGESLQHVLQRGRLPLDRAVYYAAQILHALAYAAQNGVVHCDVTPANIIITPEGAAKLTDFGLARAATDLQVATAGVAMGSPWYMAPEQVRAVTELDTRTDVYSMAAVLYEMLTARKLFDAAGSFAVLRAQVETVPNPASSHNREVPAALDMVLGRALAKDPAARFQTATEFALAIQEAVGIVSGIEATTRPRQFRPSRVALALTLVSGVMATVLYTSPIRSHRGRGQAPVNAVRNAAAWKPTPSEPPPTVEFVAPAATPQPAIAEPMRDPAGSPSQSKPVPPRMRPLAASRPEPVADHSEKATARPAVTKASSSHPEESALPDPPAVETEWARPVTPEPSTTPAESSQAVQEEAPEQSRKTGNRFVRALGKLNPFRKNAKSDPSPSDKTGSQKN